MKSLNKTAENAELSHGTKFNIDTIGACAIITQTKHIHTT